MNNGKLWRMGKMMSLFVFFVLIFSQDSLIYASGELVEYNQESILILLRYIAFFCCVLFCAFCSSHGKGVISINQVKSQWVILMIALVIISMGFNRDFDGIYIVISMVLSLVITHTLDRDSYFHAFRKVMYTIAFLSLIIYFSFLLFEPALVGFRDNIGNSSFFRSVFERLLYKCYSPWIRANSALFRERGVFAMYTVIAFMLLLYEDQRITPKNLVEVIVYVVSLISSGSSVAFMSMGILLIGYVCSSLQKVNAKLFFLVLCGSIAGFSFIQKMMSTLILKFDSSSYLGDSGITRWMSIKIPFFSILANPVLGIGAGHFSEVYKNSIKEIPGMSSTAFTNTILGIGSYFGVTIMILYLVGLLRFSKSMRIKSVNWIFIFCVLILFLFSQNESCMTFFWSMVFWGILSKGDVKYEV